MKKFLLFFSLVFFVQIISAQEIDLPPVSTLKTQADLERTKGDLVRAANWLEQTSLDSNKERRKDVERFVFMWISASKKVNVEMNQKILSLDEKNPGLVMIYTAAAAKYYVEHPKSPKPFQSQLAGLKAVTNVYRKKIAITKDHNLDELVKAQKRGTVRKWLMR